MLRFSVKPLLYVVLSFMTSISVQAQETTSTTTVNPYTQESTTTSVDQATQETTVTTTNPITHKSTITITTPAPAPRETVSVPQGYKNCFKVAAGWFNNVWVPEHTVCQYDSSVQSAQGQAWVEGHWMCTQYKFSDGECTKWEWKSGHWVKTFQVY